MAPEARLGMITLGSLISEAWMPSANGGLAPFHSGSYQLGLRFQTSRTSGS